MSAHPSSGQVSSYRWVVLSAFIFIALLSQILWLTFAPVSSDVAAFFQVSTFDVSLLSLVWPVVFVVLAIPVGIFIDRHGFTSSIRVAAVFLAVFAVLRIFATYGSHSFTVLLITQIGAAVCQPFIFGSITKLAISWFPHREQGLATGLGTIGLFLGMMLALVIVPPLYLGFGITMMLTIVAVLCIVGAVLFFALGREGAAVSASEGSASFALSDLWMLSKNRDFAILEYGFFVAVGGFTAILTWLDVMLNSLHGTSSVDAGLIGGVLIIGGIIGSIAIPALSDRVKRIKVFVILDLAVGTVMFYLVGVFSSFILLLVTSLVMGFFLMSALPLVLELSNRIAGIGMEGRASSLLWFFSQVGSIVLIAALDPAASFGGGYQSSILLIVVLWVVAFLLFLLLKEKRAAMNRRL
jgi:predicted MFS family arabinose efflux permease